MDRSCWIDDDRHSGIGIKVERPPTIRSKKKGRLLQVTFRVSTGPSPQKENKPNAQKVREQLDFITKPSIDPVMTTIS
jgi:hypothetical protein